MSTTRALSTAFGLLMVAAVALQADAPGLIAVMACVAAIALSDPSPLLSALSGLNATCYLLLRHGGGRESITQATIVAVLTSSALGLVATSIPIRLPWVPLAAPLAVFVVFVIVVQPLRVAQRGDQSR